MRCNRPPRGAIFIMESRMTVEVKLDDSVLAAISALEREVGDQHSTRLLTRSGR